MGDFTIDDSLKEAFSKKNINYSPLRMATAEEFFEAIGKAKQLNEHGAFVSQHSIAEYREMTLLMTQDSTAGIAIEKNANIVSAFNGGNKRGLFQTLLPVAIKLGGRKLDNFDSDKLSSMYEMYGFWPISSTKFDRQEAPIDWNYTRDGEPNIVFWIHNGDTAEDVILNLGNYEALWDDVKEFDTYEAAELFRDALIDEIDELQVRDGEGE